MNIRILKISAILFGLIALSATAYAQVVATNPASPHVDQMVTIIFDAGQGNAALKDVDGKVYFHAGMITGESRDEKDWKCVVGNWGKPDERVEMKKVGENLFEARFKPSEFFNLPAGTEAHMMAFVFRNADGTKVAKTADNTDILISFEGYRPAEKIQPEYLFQEMIYKSHRLVNNSLFVTTSQGALVFRPFTDSIVEVGWYPKGFWDFYPSHAVAMKPTEVKTNITETSSLVVFDLGGLQVLVRKNPFQVSYLRNGNPFLTDEKGFFSRNDGSGIRFQLSIGEKLYGSGGRASGLNLRGKKLGLYNRPDYNYEIGAMNLNYMIPTLLSSNNYFIFFDNPHKGWIDADSKGEGVMEFGFGGGSMHFFLIVGKNAASALKQFSVLTGKQEILPRWAYGNLQSRMAYRNQAETEEIVQKMLDADFPIDALILDFYWFGDSILGHLGRLDWWKPAWPEPEKMIQSFKERGIRTITISEPYIIDSLKNWQLANKLGILVTDSTGKTFVDPHFYFGPGSLIDIFKPEAQDWLWKEYRKQFDIGVEGLWGDLGEPESHPAAIRHVWGKADEVHGIYGHYWAKSIYDRFRHDFPEKRLFFLARSGYAGTQRFGIVPWSGDVARSWGGLQAQLPAMLNMSLSGIPYMHSDAGGFALGKKDDELYTRWLQFAVFSPILRPHGSGMPSEPVFFNDTTQRIVRQFMKLRYELLPYIYTTAWQTTTNGSPLVRPMFWQNPDDQRFDELFSQYYFGDHLLVAPVTEAGKQTMDIELPKGLWYHFWTGKRVQGGKRIQVQLSLESIPVFAKGGSVIPRIAPVNHTDLYSSRELFLHVYLPEGNTALHGSMYEDDGQSYSAIEQQDFELLNFDGQMTEQGVEMSFSRKGNGYPGMPESRLVEMIVYGYPKTMKTVSFGEAKLTSLNTKAVREKKQGFWLDDNGLWHIRFVWFGNDETLKMK